MIGTPTQLGTDCLRVPSILRAITEIEIDAAVEALKLSAPDVWEQVKVNVLRDDMGLDTETFGRVSYVTGTVCESLPFWTEEDRANDLPGQMITQILRRAHREVTGAGRKGA